MKNLRHRSHGKQRSFLQSSRRKASFLRRTTLASFEPLELRALLSADGMAASGWYSSSEVSMRMLMGSNLSHMDVSATSSTSQSSAAGASNSSAPVAAPHAAPIATPATPGVASQLVIATQPPTTAQSFSYFNVPVAVEDAEGNVVTSFSGSVTLNLGSAPQDAILRSEATLGTIVTGAQTVQVVNGVANFTNLMVDQSGSYTLQATANGLTAATTNTITVTPGFKISLVAQDTTGSHNTITSVAQGTDFSLAVFVQDVRSPENPVPGVSAAWLNITYQSALASIDAHSGQNPDSSLAFDTAFPLTRSGTLTPGNISDVGAAVVAVPQTNGPQLLFRATVHANHEGSLVFQSAFDQQPEDAGHDSFFAHPVLTLPQQSIDFGALTLAITGNGPEGTDKTVTTNEDTSYVFSTTDFPFTDTTNPTATLAAVQITTLPTAGTITDNGAAVTAGQFVAVADITGGKLKFNPAANANGASYATFTFQVQDSAATGNLDTTPNTITVNVTAVNDPPQGADLTKTTLEEQDLTFAASDFALTDPNDTPANTLAGVKITTVPTSGALKLSGGAVTAGQLISLADITAGNLKYSPAVDAAGAGIGTFTFQVQDNGGTANNGVDIDPQANIMTINVTNVNDAPSGTSKTVSVTENTTHALGVADFGFTDTHDTPPNGLLGVQIITLTDAGTLQDNGADVTSGQFIPVADITGGKLTFKPDQDTQGAPYTSFTFKVQDDGGTANSGIDIDPTAKTLTFNVVPPNQAPAGTDKTIGINEDAPYTFATGDFGFTDPDDTPPNSLLAVKVSTLPDGGTLTNNGVAVTAGQFVSATDITAGKLKYTPPANQNGDGLDSFTFQVQDDGGTDNNGTDTDQSPNTITFDVTAVNDAPQGANNTLTTLEDTALTFSPGDFGFSDPNDTPPDALLAVKITTVPTTGSLTNNGAAVTAGQFISLADLTAGNLKFTPAADAAGPAKASFTFQVQDDGGIANGGIDTDPTARTMTINVTAVNDAPLGADKTVTTGTNQAYSFTSADFGFTDLKDNPANTLLAVKVATLPATGTLTDNGVAVTAGQFIPVADINAGNLKYTPPTDANGNGLASFTFQVQDNGGTANNGIDLDPTANTVTVNVVAPNHAPAGTDKTITTNEDTAYAFATADFGFSDANDTPPNTLLAVKITTLPAAGTGSLTDNGTAVTAGQSIAVADITGGLLKFTPALNANGTAKASFTFQVQDNGGTANNGVDLDPTANTVTFNVTAVNDPPQGANITLTTLEDTALVLSVANFGFTDTNDTPPNTLLAVKIATLPTTGTLTDNGVAVTAGQLIPVADVTGGLLKFTPAANSNGTARSTFTFQLQDNGGTANGGVDLSSSPNTVTFNVTSVNDAPQGANKTVSMAGATSRAFTVADFGFTDPNDNPANTLFSVKIATLPTTGTITLNGTAITAGQFITATDITNGALVYTPPTTASGSPLTTFTFQVRDNGGVDNGGVDVDPTANTITFNVTPASSTISGHVFFDSDNSAGARGGTFTGQSAIDGTEVLLFAINSDGTPNGVPQQFMIGGSDAANAGVPDGEFRFTVPQPGNYNLVFVPPSDQLLTGTAVSGSLADDPLPGQTDGGVGLTIHVTGGGMNGTDYNFYSSGFSSSGGGLKFMQGSVLAGLYAAAGTSPQATPAAVSAPVASPAAVVAPVAAPASQAVVANNSSSFTQSGDTVTIHGTAGDDQLVFNAGGGEISVTLNGVTREFDSSAVNFVFDGGGGHDTVTATGSSGNDTAVLQPGSGTLSGSGYKLTVTNVANLHVSGGGGQDTATVNDSALNDILQASGDQLSIDNDGGLSTSLSAFAEVHASSTHGGNDVAQIGALDYALSQEGNWTT